jgi:TonB dependent receptor/TonB-dependent Receptor Plug Domain/CarboxypepD_reg-like domain
MVYGSRLIVPSLLVILIASAMDPGDACARTSSRRQQQQQQQQQQQKQQPPGRLRGQVIDSRTGQALSRIRVEISGTERITVVERVDPSDNVEAAPRASATTGSIGERPPTVTPPTQDPPESLDTVRTIVRPITKEIVTDADGHFEVDIPPGKVGVTISVVGYVLSTREIKVGADQTVDLTIPLTEGTGSYTEEVKVTGERYTRTETGVPTEQTLGSADLQNLKSTLADDPMRAVQTLPGVANSDDFKSEFAIRGSDFRHVGVTLDGVPSPLLLHTVHGVTDSGSLAMINSDILDSVTLLSGSYPQRYGNRTGATIDFRTREGSRDRPHFRLSASAINASGVAEGPIGKNRRGSWLISARKSYLDWLVRRIDPGITGTFGFVDAHGKLAYDLSPAHALQTNVVIGRSRFHEREREYGLNSLDVGLNRAVLINTSLRSTFSPSMVLTQRVYGVSGRFQNLNPLGDEIAHGVDRDLSYRVELTNSLAANLLLESGAHVQWLHGDALERTFGDGGAYERRFSGSATRQAAFGHLRWQARPFLTVSPGARVDRWSLTDQTQVSPWVQAEMALPRSFLIAGGTGVYRQAPDLDQVVGPRGLPSNDTERAWHGDIGIGQRVGAWRWQAIVFAREEYDMLRLPGMEPRVFNGFYVPESFESRWQNALRGRARGLELFLQRRSTNGLSGWIGYAYAATRYMDTIRDEEFIADVDQRHTFNVYGSYRISDRTNVSGRFRAGSNVPLVGYLRQNSDRYFLTSMRNELRLPTYSRLDLRATRTYEVAEGRLSLFVEVINLYNRRNLRARSIRLNSRRMEAFNVTEEMFPILPSVGVMVEF